MKTFTRLALMLAATTALTTGAMAEGRTFKVWWYEPADSALGIAWDAALAKFKEAHPDVEVQFELKTFDQINQAGSLILNSSDAPDLMEYNKGNGTAGLVASQGLLAPLDEAYAQYGWDATLNEAALQLGRYDENGVFGSGPLYGIPNYGEFVSVFYNTDMLAAAGLSVPTTLAEFEAVMDAFVAQGVVPIAEAANDYPAQHLMYLLALSQATPEWVADFQGLKAELDPAPFLYAGQKLQEWVEKGYLSKDATGMKADDMAAQFTSGASPFVVTGTWYGASFGGIEGFTASQFLFPGNHLSAGSTGNIWVVPNGADNKDLAYEFISLTLSQDVQNLMGNSGGVPIAADPAQITDRIGSLETELFNQLVAQGGLGFYPDWPVPGFYNEVLQATQAVIGGNATPEEFAQRLKDAYDDGMSM